MELRIAIADLHIDPSYMKAVMGTKNSWICTLAVGLVSSLVLTIFPAVAQPWPQRAVHFIVPAGPGSSTDIAARLFADRLAERWKQPVVVENRPGGEGVIGVSGFVNMRDDHALLASFAGPISVLPVMREKLPYDPVRDLVPISSAADSFSVVAASASLRINSIAELVIRGRNQPGKLNYHAAPGAFPLLFAGFIKAAGLEMASVSYRETILSTQDLAEDRIQVVITTMTNVLPQVNSGKIRLLAVTNKSRAPLAPEIATAIEAGYPDLTYEAFSGFFGAGNISSELRDRIAADIRAVAAEPIVRDRLAAVGQGVRGNTPAEFSATIEEQRSKMAAIAKLIGTKPER